METPRPDARWSDPTWPEATRPELTWLDEAAGPVVRQYAVTRGTADNPAAQLDLRHLDLLTNISAVPGVGPGTFQLLPEHRAILDSAHHQISLAELASHLGLALGVVRLLIGDLLREGLVSTYDTTAGGRRPESHVLKAVINGLRAL